MPFALTVFSLPPPFLFSSPSPQTGVLTRVAAVFVSLTFLIAYLAARPDSTATSRLLVGAAGASVILGGAAYATLSKNAGLLRPLVSRPNLCPPLPVTEGSAAAAGADAARSKIA